MLENRSKYVLICLFGVISIASAQSGKLKRGQACDKDAFWFSKISPKFQSAHRNEANTVCDDSKGLVCVFSEDPEFKQDAYEDAGPPGKVCDCMENFYYDAVSGECRILVGLACDPNPQTESGELTWKDKCPEDAYCSTDLGRYGPRNAKGMCRCKEGFYVNSFWFVNGGGTICENPEEETRRKKERMHSDSNNNNDDSLDYPNTNVLQF